VYVEEEDEPGRARFRVEPLDVGELLVDNLDDISAVLAMVEAESYR
jgi:hypothetical protein